MYHKDGGDHLQIFIATIDISEGEDGLINEVQLTDANVDSTQAAFCGSSHFVWIRNDGYGGELCYQEFNAQGATGDMKCWFDGLGDALEDVHPSCDSTGGTIAWARENGTYAGTHDIWKLDTSDDDASEAMEIHASHQDETAPVWSWDDEWIEFAWDEPEQDSSQDYDIWAVHPDGTSEYPVTTNTVTDDTEPSWGPAAP